jgi:hypothetical protein
MPQETGEPTKAFEEYRGVAITCRKLSGVTEFSCTLPGPTNRKLVGQSIGAVHALTDIALADCN